MNVYKIQYELSNGIWQAFVIADNELEALQLLNQELAEYEQKMIRLFDIKEYTDKGVISDTCLFA